MDDLALVTGTTVVNRTIEPILELAGAKAVGAWMGLLLFLLVLFAQGVLSGNSARYKKVIRTEPNFIKHGSNINRTNMGNAYEN